MMPKPHEMSFQSSEFSINAISDKMSISGGSSMNRFNLYGNSIDSGMGITGFPAMNNNDGVAQIVAQHLKHDSNSTEIMLEQLQQQENNNNNDDEQAINIEPMDKHSVIEHQLLFPIEPMDKHSQSVASPATTHSTFSMDKTNGNYNGLHM